MNRTALALFTLWSVAASARPWNGIDPGVDTRAEVLQKFGPPTRTVKTRAAEILAYLGKSAIPGTTQAQFKVDAKTGVVERIDVFPRHSIDRQAIENRYGHACPAPPVPETPCYLKKVTGDSRVYFHYPRLGLAIFFKADGKTVSSLIFQPAKT